MVHGGLTKTVEVSDGVYAYIQGDGGWLVNNTGFAVDRQGVISIDSCATERRTLAYLDAIARVSSKKVHTLINTHHHGDHTFGNSLFTGATVVGHEQVREQILAFGAPRNRGVWNDVDWGNLEVAPPFLTYATGITLWSDEVRCDVTYVGMPAHTTNDSLIHFPDKSVLFAGDLLFKGGVPFVLMGSVRGAIEVLEKVVRPLGAQTIVPGHGSICGPEVIEEALRYLHFVEKTAYLGRDAGLTPLEAAQATDLGEFGGLLDTERIVGNLHRAYAELNGAEPGVPLDTSAAWADMIEYNGGRPLTCHA